MGVLYFSHSYRREDAGIVGYFGRLLRDSGFIPALDPPSPTVNAARLQKHLKDSDGMVAVLTRRNAGVSPHIAFEALLCLQARKPMAVFIEDSIAVPWLPHRVLQVRFSRSRYFRQLREHRHALSSLRSYIGQSPPPPYRPSPERRTCVVIGTEVLTSAQRDALLSALDAGSYELSTGGLPCASFTEALSTYTTVAYADLAVEVVDAPGQATGFARGCIAAAFVPTISLTADPRYAYDDYIPREYQPRYVDSSAAERIGQIVAEELTVTEQGFVELDDAREVGKYVELLLQYASPVGEYSLTGRNVFIKELTMGDQYKIGQAGAVGPHSHAHDMKFEQAWNEQAGSTDLGALSAELEKLRLALRGEAVTPEQDVAVAEVSQAAAAAKAQDGSKMMKHLAGAGKWALDVAEKIGVAVASAAIKSSLGL